MFDWGTAVFKQQPFGIFGKFKGHENSSFGKEAKKTHDKIAGFFAEYGGEIPQEDIDKLRDLQKQAYDVGQTIHKRGGSAPIGTADSVRAIEYQAQKAMDDIEQRGIEGEFDESIKESKKRRFTVKEVRMWMKKLEENRYKKVYNSDARRVAWMVNNEGVELSEMPKSMSKKWTKAQYGRERYLATEFVKSKSEQMNEEKLTEGFKKIAKKNVKYKDKTGTYNWQIESGIDTDVMGGNTPKIILSYQHEDEKGFPTSGGNFFWLKEKDGTPYTPQKAKALVNKISNKKIGDFHRKSTKPSGSGNLIVMKGNKFIREGKLTSEQKLRESIREIIKEQLNEQKFKKVILPNDMKTKIKVSKMIKQLKLKIDKDYDVKALKARGGDQVISILPKHYNKFIELAMQNKLNPRG